MDASIYINACDYVARHCSSICNTKHSSAWLFDQLIRFFEAPGNQAVEAVTIPVFLNAPVMKPGEATLHRDGSVQLRVAP